MTKFCSGNPLTVEVMSNFSEDCDIGNRHIDYQRTVEVMSNFSEDCDIWTIYTLKNKHVEVMSNFSEDCDFSRNFVNLPRVGRSHVQF